MAFSADACLSRPPAAYQPKSLRPKARDPARIGSEFLVKVHADFEKSVVFAPIPMPCCWALVSINDSNIN